MKKRERYTRATEPIDIVIMWVDGSDPEWLDNKSKYSTDKISADGAISRYRDWNNLQYIFRGIEQYMPWVRKIHFVTAGHLPKWLDTSNDRLNVVQHADFMPSEYLPTFSSHPIELNLHRINGLAEQFILFNDDMFAVRPIKRRHFFTEDGKPREHNGLITVNSTSLNDLMPHIFLNNNAVINAEFNAKRVLLNSAKDTLLLQSGLEASIRNLLLTPFATRTIQSLDVPHMPSPLLKSTYEEVWSKYFAVLDQTSRNKFRSMGDVNQYLFKQWQVASGNYKALNFKKNSCIVSNFPEDIAKLRRAMDDSNCRMVCVNDNQVMGSFEQTIKEINKIFIHRMPLRSSFEKES